MQSFRFPPSKTFIFAVLAILGFSLRLLASTPGYNNDLHLFWVWAQAADHCNLFACYKANGQVIVSLYGPHVFHLLKVLQQTALWLNPGDPIHTFHHLTAGFLGVVDIFAAVIIYRFFNASLLAGGLLLLSPALILLNGYHSQIDPISVALGIAAVALYQRSWLGAALLMAGSFLIKQSLIYFPIWILMSPNAGKLRTRLKFSSTVYATYFLCLLPTLLDYSGAWDAYRSNFSNWSLNGFPDGLSGTTTLKVLMDLMLPLNLQETLFGVQPLQIKAGFMKVFTLLMLSSGFILGAKHKPKQLIAFYLIALVAFSPRLAIQYLAIPIYACAILSSSKLLSWYHFFAAATIATSFKNIYQFYESQLIFLARLLGRGDFSAPQSWLFLFLTISVAKILLDKQSDVFAELKEVLAGLRRRIRNGFRTRAKAC